MEPLKDCLKIFHFLHLCKKKSTITCGCIQISNLILQFLSMFSLKLSCLLMVIYCILKVNDLFELLGVGYTFIGFMSIQVIFWSLVKNNSIVEQSVDHLKNVIKQRNFLNKFINFVSFAEYKFILGCNKSDLIAVHYKKRELFLWNVLKKLFIYSSFVLGSIFTIPIGMPIMYALFGVSPPNTWYLPFQVV